MMKQQQECCARYDAVSEARGCTARVFCCRMLAFKNKKKIALNVIRFECLSIEERGVAEASLAHRSEHGQIPRQVSLRAEHNCSCLRLEIERASGVIYSSCHRVFSLSPSWCHHDSSWIRLDCDYETFFGARTRGGMLCESCTERSPMGKLSWVVRWVAWRRRQEECMEITIECRVRMRRRGKSAFDEILYHWIDGTWWFTMHSNDMVLPTLTWISADPTIFANFTAAEHRRRERKREEN